MEQSCPLFAARPMCDRRFKCVPSQHIEVTQASECRPERQTSQDEMHWAPWRGDANQCRNRSTQRAWVRAAMRDSANKLTKTSVSAGGRQSDENLIKRARSL